MDIHAVADSVPGKVVSLPPEAQRVSSPLKAKAWEAALAGHPHRQWVKLLLDGMILGVRLGFDGRPVRSAGRNLPSASENASVVRDYLKKEQTRGSISGPWSPGECGEVVINRFGVIPKSGKPGRWRLIVDLSFPDGGSVNGGIDKSLTAMRYASVLDAAKMLLHLGPGTLMAKIDIASAYRIIPVHPKDRYLLGMSFDKKVYIDTQLPFGLSSAPVLFNAYADGLEWIVCTKGVKFILHYLDDFLVLGSPESKECQSALDSLKDCCQMLGVPLAMEKIAGPVTVLQFLGFELDSETMEIRLPKEKLDQLVLLLGSWVSKKSCVRKELEHLLGKLNHACTVLPQGRVFLRRMYDLLSVARKGHFHIRLNQGFRSDLAWWQSFMSHWNGRSLMALVGAAVPSVVFSSDASGGWGCGALWGNHWIQGAWPIGWEDTSIMVKELCPVVCACAIWGDVWRGQVVLGECDNLSVVCAVNSGTARESSGMVMHLLRTLFFVVSYFGFSLRLKHVPGKENGPADAISRDNCHQFFLQVPTADKEPTPIPAPLWKLVVMERPDWLSNRWRTLFTSSWQQELRPQQPELMQWVEGASRSFASDCN